MPRRSSPPACLLPRRGVALLSVRDRDKPGAVKLGRILLDRGFDIVATNGTAVALAEGGVACRRVNKVREGRPHIVDMIKNDELALIVNTTEGKQAIRESHPDPFGGRAAQGHLLHDTGGGDCHYHGSGSSGQWRRQSPAGPAQGVGRVRKMPITARGAEMLREELRRLKTEARPRIIQAIAEARGHGDLKENAEYHAAKEEQGFIEGRIQRNRIAPAEFRNH